MKKRVSIAMVVLGLMTALVFGGRVQAVEPEPELVIVKYGKVTVKSPVPDAKVYIDDLYKGAADTLIESVMVGDHTISCRTESQTVTGTFTVKKDETLKLEARYDLGRLVAHVEHEKPEKVEVEKKPKIETPKPEKKKPVVEVKKEVRKSPEEERRILHLSILKIYYDDIDSQDVKITHKSNPKIISKFTEKKVQSGTYYRTKKDILLCDAGPCDQQWSASFSYTDDTGNVDTFSLTWKQIVFNGITPAGTSKRELLFCLNGACKSMENTSASDTSQAWEVGRYHITWSKTSLVIRRSDLMKEVVAAGGAVEAY